MRNKHKENLVAILCILIILFLLIQLLPIILKITLLVTFMLCVYIGYQIWQGKSKQIIITNLKTFYENAKKALVD